MRKRVLGSLLVVLLALTGAAVVGWPSWWRGLILQGLLYVGAVIAVAIATVIVTFTLSFLYYMLRGYGSHGAFVEAGRTAWNICAQLFQGI